MRLFYRVKTNENEIINNNEGKIIHQLEKCVKFEPEPMDVCELGLEQINGKFIL